MILTNHSRWLPTPCAAAMGARGSDGTDGSSCTESQAELFCALPAVAAGLALAGESSASCSRSSPAEDRDEPSAAGVAGAFGSKATFSSPEQFPQTDLDSNKNKVPKKRKKRKNRRRITICTTHCRYAVVRRMALKFGMSEVSEDEPWDLFWTDNTVPMERAKEMKSFQKINHFPGMGEISRKDLLARNLNRMLKMSPKDYNFFPKTWCLPADCHDLLAYARAHKNCTFICKPDTGCQGRGICLAKSVKDVKLGEHMICQLYISRPFLIDGFKFDLRIYTLITSCDPLRVYIYNEGLARFATSRYQEPTLVNISNVYMHLTNYSVNKHSRTYVVDDEAGSKRKISSINKWLESRGYDVPELWSRIDEVIVKTVIAAQPMLKHSYNTSFSTHDDAISCFELLGFDIMLDHKLKPYILEVNHSPSYHTETPIDLDVKEGLITDTLRMLNLQKTNKHKVLEEERRRTQERLLQGSSHKESRGSVGDASAPREQGDAQAQWELQNAGNFRRVYPPGDGGGPDKYLRFFQQNASSVYQETAASRARDECTRLLREELETKARLEATRRVGSKPRDAEKTRSESPGCQEPGPCRTRVLHTVVRRQAARKEGARTEGDPAACSFSPEPIREEEEQSRLTALHHREMLVHSQGIVSVVKEVLHRSEKFKREHAVLFRHSNHHVVPVKLPALQQAPTFMPHAPLDRKNEEAAALVIYPTLKGPETSVSEDASQQCSVLQSQKGLAVQCSNAPLSSRPAPLQAVWAAKHDWRSTRAHNARAHTNNAKLRQLYQRQSNHVL
ncbi:tubulin polyglutamylase ttll6-like [Bacillus rossius redtenbacheri]|uniref:tubulin polyglutamylase ttll6-like n=1 Tax=Bacillus rossius redtenbacheri TaxID=93214 RepID=UPI002FDCF807